MDLSFAVFFFFFFLPKKNLKATARFAGAEPVMVTWNERGEYVRTDVVKGFNWTLEYPSREQLEAPPKAHIAASPDLIELGYEVRDRAREAARKKSETIACALFTSSDCDPLRAVGYLTFESALHADSGMYHCLKIELREDKDAKTKSGVCDCIPGLIHHSALEGLPVIVTLDPARNWLSDILKSTTVLVDDEISLQVPTIPKKSHDAHQFYQLAPSIEVEKTDKRKLVMMLLHEYWERLGTRSTWENRNADCVGLGLPSCTRGSFSNTFNSLGITMRIKAAS